MSKRDNKRIGILAYGSLISDPGAEIEPLIVKRISTETPFPVEFARISKSRGGAPTVVPHAAGKTVRAELLVLDQSVSKTEATDMLWRREVHKVGAKATYQTGNSPNAVLVKDWPRYMGIDHVLYTDFNLAGKLNQPEAADLARRAIDSVKKAAPGKDGISYLSALKKDGIETNMSAAYEAAILQATGVLSLENAVQKLIGN